MQTIARCRGQLSHMEVWWIAFLGFLPNTQSLHREFANGTSRGVHPHITPRLPPWAARSSSAAAPLRASVSARRPAWASAQGPPQALLLAAAAPRQRPWPWHSAIPAAAHIAHFHCTLSNEYGRILTLRRSAAGPNPSSCAIARRLARAVCMSCRTHGHIHTHACWSDTCNSCREQLLEDL